MAKVNGQVITAKELEAATKDELAQAATKYQEEIYEIQKQALEIIIVERLVENRAKSESITPDQLLHREVKARITRPSEEEIKEVYDATADKFGGDFPEFEEVEATIREAVQGQLEDNAQAEYFDELIANAKVEILLPPVLPDARDIPTEGPSKGNPNAPVTIVEFADFECPFCVNAQATVDRILKTYGDDIRYIFRDFPMPFHRFAQKAAEAAHCAGKQGKYWEMHAVLFQNSDALTIADLKGYAQEMTLDSEQFNTCLDTSITARKLEIRGSPTFFINGRQISGAQPFERFKEIIDSELKTASQPAK
jgi:protein-disulfide isomerase